MPDSIAELREYKKAWNTLKFSVMKSRDIELYNFMELLELHYSLGLFRGFIRGKK